LGHRSVAEAQDYIDSREFAEWLAYDECHPIGPERDDWRAGLIAATIANVNRGKNQPAFNPDDFMPKFGPLRKTKTDAEIKQAVSGWGRIYNRVLAEKKKARKK